MEPMIVERGEAAVLGTMARINPMKADYDRLWQEYMRFDDAVKAVAVDRTYYGVYYDAGEEDSADFVAGMLVEPGAEAPAGLTKRSLPAGTYAAFPCTMSTIGPTWHDIYARWLPASGYAEDESRPCFEHYPSDDTGPTAPATIFVAVRPA